MKLKLLTAHRHDGIDLVAGQILTLPEEQTPLAAWLVGKNLAERLPDEQTATPEAPSPTSEV